MPYIFQRDNHGWLTTQVDEFALQQAYLMMRNGDAIFPNNLYQEVEGDARWVGFLGEFLFNEWLGQVIEPEDFNWLNDVNGAGRTDFEVFGYGVGVKSVKRSVPMRPTYEAQISTRHANEPSDYYVFGCYETNARVFHILGAIRKQDYLREAVYYGPGEFVHPKYQIRQGHEIYNAPVGILTPCELWLQGIRR